MHSLSAHLLLRQRGDHILRRVHVLLGHHVPGVMEEETGDTAVGVGYYKG